MKDKIYLDYQATTPCDERVVQRMLPYFTECFGNPNSDHDYGQVAAMAVEKARQEVADILGCQSQEVIFTSGATESNNLAIQGCVRHLLNQSRSGGSRFARQVITVATEHKTVLETVRSLEQWGVVPYVLPVTREGLVDQDQLKAALKTPTMLVSIMGANNETGVVQDIPALSALAHEYGALFHCDMAQSLGKMAQPLSMQTGHIDLASVSGHKIYGPKGIGALYVRRRPRVRLASLYGGGYQERGIRPGTLPVPLIVGLGAACQLVQNEAEAESQRLGSYKKRLLMALYKVKPDLKVNGSLSNSLSGCINLCFPDIRTLDLFARIPHLCLSSGSACNQSFLSPSHVLSAMGLSEKEAMASFRLSFGRMTTEKDVDETIHGICQALRELMVGCQDTISMFV